MNNKYERYIEYIVNDIQAPYFNNMKEMYGLKDDEYEMVLSKVFKQPVTIRCRSVYDEQGNRIYYEDSYGFWEKSEYNDQGKIIYYETSNGYWAKYEYDDQGNIIYYESNDGVFINNR